MKLSEIIRALRETYCSTIAVEFLHIQNKPMRRWLIQQMESTRNRPSFDAEKKLVVLEDLIHAEEFEHFMHTAFIGQKRFSLEGAEVVIPALHHVVDSAPSMGITEIILGMTHRGRLTVLNRILGKPLEEVFSEFEGHEDPGRLRRRRRRALPPGLPDGPRGTRTGTAVRVNLVANPSHLESVGPVVQGMARAVQRERDDTERKMVVPIVLHGDAAFSGQGVVAETFNLSTLKGYKTGGTMHVVINNQIGFTTSSRDARSTFFPTDVAKMLPVPVFHVNGDDPRRWSTRWTSPCASARPSDGTWWWTSSATASTGTTRATTLPSRIRSCTGSSRRRRARRRMYAEKCREAGHLHEGAGRGDAHGASAPR